MFPIGWPQCWWLQCIIDLHEQGARAKVERGEKGIGEKDRERRPNVRRERGEERKIGYPAFCERTEELRTGDHPMPDPSQIAMSSRFNRSVPFSAP